MYTRMYILCTYIVVVCLVTKSCPTLLKPHGYSPPGSSVHGIFQAKMLEWVAILSPGDLPGPGLKPRSPVLQTYYLVTEPPGNTGVGCYFLLQREQSEKSFKISTESFFNCS